ncbi:MAG TPA: ATP-binding protein [Xanthobacteraceae bacterium]
MGFLPVRPWGAQRSRTIRGTLILIVVACVLPAWIGVAMLIQNIYERESARATQNTMMTARALMLAVDRHLASAQIAMEVLATSTELRSDNFAGFHQRASGLLAKLPGNVIVLSDESGQQLVNTLVPYGEPLPVIAGVEIRGRVFRTRAPTVSDLLIGPLVKVPLVAIDVPVFRGGEVKYRLSLILFSQRLSEFLAGQNLPAGWVGAIFDTSGVEVARSERADEFVGREGPPNFIREMAGRSSGIVNTQTLDGVAVHAAFARSDMSNWAVAIGVPADFLNRELYRFLGMGTAGALLLLLVGAGLAAYAANQIISAVRALVVPATALGKGEVSATPRSHIREIDEAARGLEDAFQVLQRRTEERDDAAREKELAERGARLKDEFIATVSHELRTPLTSITASLDLITNMSDERPYVTKELFAIARQNSKRLVRLVNDILDIEKLEGGKVVFDMQRVDLGLLLPRVIEADGPLAASADVNLRFENMSSYDVHGDPDRLIQVVSNLLSNAIKYSPPGAEVVVTAEDRGENVRISVRDHGPGIPQSFRRRIFEKFAQADNSDSRQKTGTGLGLSIAKEIVERLNGEVGFADAPGGGAIVFFDLPGLQRLAGNNAGARVLLCEHDIGAAAMIGERLHQAGFATDCVRTAGDAAAHAAANPYAAFLIDLEVPDGDGITLIQGLRELPAHANTPVVVVSAYPGRGRDDLRSCNLEILDWIVVPSDLPRLQEQIRAAVARIGKRPVRILHLDDDPDVLSVIARGYLADDVVVSATTVEAARQVLAAGDFDVAVIDLALGGSSGAELLPHLHDSAGHAIPVILYSAREQNPEWAGRVQAGLSKSRRSLDGLIDILRTRVTDGPSGGGLGQEAA